MADIARASYPGFRDRMMSAPGEAVEGTMNLPEAVSSSYPRFKDELAKAPGQALRDIAPYEEYDEALGQFMTKPPRRMQENPAGYVTDAMLGGLGAPGALATIAGAAGDVAQGVRLGTVGGSLAKGFDEAKQIGKTWMGLEGVPKFEISDEAAKLGELPGFFQTKKLSEVMEHPELFNQYPELSDMQVQKMLPMTANVGKRGEFLMQEGKPVARVAGDLPTEDAKSTLLHEIQHAIQEREGFAKGGNLQAVTFDDMLSEASRLRKQGLSADQIENELMKIDSFEKYRRLGGEVEARNVQGRMNMTEAERGLKPFTETYDVPLEQQIIRRKGGLASSMEPDAEFLGTMDDGEGGVIELFNITKKGHPREGSTVSRASLMREGLQVPEMPRKPAPTSLEDFASEMDRLKS